MEEEGLRVDPADLSSRQALLWSVSGKLTNQGEAFLKRTEGFSPPIPPQPARPEPKKRERTVSDLVVAYRTAKWDGWSQSSRVALVPVFRVLEDVLGDRELSTISREDARGLMALVRRLPANLGKRQELAGLSLTQAVERSEALGLPVIEPGTVNRGYMVHLAAIFNFARKEQWVSSNPFEALTVHDPVAAQDKRDPFTPRVRTH